MGRIVLKVIVTSGSWSALSRKAMAVLKLGAGWIDAIAFGQRYFLERQMSCSVLPISIDRSNIRVH